MLTWACRSTRFEGPSDAVDRIPLEVWARIFEHLRPDSEDVSASIMWRQPGASHRLSVLLTKQARLYQLNLVCPKFRSVFLQHPELSNEISIHFTSAAHALLPSALLWIQRWRRSLHTFNSFCGEEHHELLLAAMASPGSLLDSVYLTNAPASAVFVLTIFSHLRQCTFTDHEDQLDLLTLQAVPSLEELRLSYGSYSNIPSDGHLTSLCSCFATLEFSPAPTEHDISLKLLSMTYCSASGLHGSGLAACKSLASLVVVQSTLTAANSTDVLRVADDKVASIPARMSELTCLTSLEMNLASSTDDHFDIDWVYSLVNLKCLELDIQHSFQVGGQFTQLSQLTSLKLSIGVFDGSVLWASYSVDWEIMQNLEILKLEGPISCDARMLQLTSIQGLRQLVLTDLYPCADNSTAPVLAQIGYQLATKCPQVQVLVSSDVNMREEREQSILDQLLQ